MPGIQHHRTDRGVSGRPLGRESSGSTSPPPSTRSRGRARPRMRGARLGPVCQHPSRPPMDWIASVQIGGLRSHAKHGIVGLDRKVSRGWRPREVDITCNRDLPRLVAVTPLVEKADRDGDPPETKGIYDRGARARLLGANQQPPGMSLRHVVPAAGRPWVGLPVHRRRPARSLALADSWTAAGPPQ